MSAWGDLETIPKEDNDWIIKVAGPSHRSIYDWIVFQRRRIYITIRRKKPMKVPGNEAGAFDNLETNRRRVKWEIGLRYRPVNHQLNLSLPVAQDMAELKAPDDWDVMKEEYGVLGLFPPGHVMGQLRPGLPKNLMRSKDISRLREGSEVVTAGLVIRRQRPRGKVVFITIEDEFGHIPLMVFPKVYDQYENQLKSPFLKIKGKVSRRDNTFNLVVFEVTPFNVLQKAPVSKNWC